MSHFSLIADLGNLPVPTILMSLFGGLALFLLGMDLMANALKMVAGDGMRTVLAKLTTNRFTGALAGATVTAIIQSSSVTTVLLVGFISAGLMNLTQAIGVIMGANIGTTITAQIIAFKVTHYALVLIAAGFLVQFVFKNERLRGYGNAVLGLGLVFYGMQLMGDGMKPLRSFGPFIEFMENMDSPLVGIFFGAIFTGLVQSSSATTGIVIVMASQGLLSLDAGIALIFGANIGTCVTAALAALGKPRDAKRAVLVHVLFNVGGVALWFFFIPNLSQLVASISSDAPRQIANAHAVFNIANTLLFIGLAAPLANLVRKIIPDEAEPKRKGARPKYLDEAHLETPAIALDMARRELGRLGAAVLRITRNSIRAVVRGSRIDLDELRQDDAEVDDLHAAIVEFLGKLSQAELDDRQSDQLHRYLSAANYFESIGDMVETSLVDSGYRRCEANFTISPETENMLVEFHREVCEGVDRAIRSLVDNDLAIAAEVTGAKPTIEKLTAEAESHLSRRLVSDEPQRVIAFRLESEIIEYLKRMFYFAKRIAKLVEADRDP